MTPTTEYTVKRRVIPWHAADAAALHGRPLPLGRNVNHDSRNLFYRHVRRAVTLNTVEHKRNTPILDQGAVGSCTGNGEVGCLATDPLFGLLPAGHPTLNELLARKIYSGAESIDGDGPYPPNDNGSSGPSAAKAAMNLGLISGYTHCLSLADVLDALQTSAVSIGINWYDSFDNPPANGLLTISPNASVRGGHEPMLRAIDVENKLVGGDNSWGTTWGVKGSFVMSWDTLERLLGEEGDGTVSIPLGQPAPTPQPVPVPVPTPTPGPIVNGDDALLWSRTAVWAGQRHVSGNRAAAEAVNEWAQAKGFK